MLKAILIAIGTMVFFVFAFILWRHGVTISLSILSDALFVVGAIATLFSIVALSRATTIFRPLSYSVKRLRDARKIKESQSFDMESHTYFDYVQEKDEKQQRNTPYNLAFLFIGIVFVITSIVILAFI